MHIGLIIVIVLFALIFVALVVWLILLLTKEKPIEEDDTITLNFMSHYSIPIPSAIGTCVKTSKINNRFLKEISPKDLDYKTVNEGKKIENVKIVADKNHTISLPKGTLSPNRNVEIILPPTADDFPLELKEHPFGQLLMKYVEDTNNENTVVEVLKNKNKVQDKLLKKTEGMERVEEYIETDEDLNRQLSQKINDREKGPEKKSTFVQPSSLQRTE